MDIRLNIAALMQLYLVTALKIEDLTFDQKPVKNLNNVVKVDVNLNFLNRFV